MDEATRNKRLREATLAMLAKQAKAGKVTAAKELLRQLESESAADVDATALRTWVKAKRGRNYAAAGRHFGLSTQKVRQILSGNTTGHQPGSELSKVEFIARELDMAEQHRQMYVDRGQGQAIEAAGRRIRDLHDELCALKDAEATRGGDYSVEGFLDRLVAVPDELWDEAMRRRATR